MTLEASWWHSLPDSNVGCDLCPIRCTLQPERDGPCGTRGNRNGHMVPLGYGQVAAMAMDPIEKKPLYHFHPGAPILSVAALGCNLHCSFCQNWGISQEKSGRTELKSPRDIVDLALKEGSVGVAYTYSEPLVWFEFVRDTARLVREAGLLNVVVTNGFLEPEPLAELLPWLDAANVDLKSMDDSFYRKICKARLEPVLASIRAIYEAGVHLEVTNLVIPGHNDSDRQLGELTTFLSDLDRSIPLHLSAYRPAWKLEAPPTPVATLQRAAMIAREQLDHVYVGNTQLAGAADTLCPECGTSVILRNQRGIQLNLSASHCCPDCSATVSGVWG
jgi:pyruvate formate lyase activating enzyme